MTRQDAINRARTTLLTSMTRTLDTSDVLRAIAFFASDFGNYNTMSDLDNINKNIDSLIDRLNALKAIVNEDKQAIIDADADDNN